MWKSIVHFTVFRSFFKLNHLLNRIAWFEKKNEIKFGKVWFMMVYNSVGSQFLKWGINETIEIEHSYKYKTGKLKQ